MKAINSEFNLEQALDSAFEAAEIAGNILNKFFNSTQNTYRKEGHDIVTDVDILVEKEIIKHLKVRFPTHSFASEEIDKEFIKKSEWSWIIDPLDGTINYASRLPFFSTSIALQQKNETVLGVIYNPRTKEMYSAVKDLGSFLNGKKLQVSNEPDISNYVLSFMLTSHYNEKQIDDILEKVRLLSTATRGLRLYVSQALELAFIASGKLEGTICVKSHGYSSAAGALVVREAGGKVTDINGNEFDNNSRSILATNSVNHDKILGIIKNINKLSERRKFDE